MCNYFLLARYLQKLLTDFDEFFGREGRAQGPIDKILVLISDLIQDPEYFIVPQG